MWGTAQGKSTSHRHVDRHVNPGGLLDHCSEQHETPVIVLEPRARSPTGSRQPLPARVHTQCSIWLDNKFPRALATHYHPSTALSRENLALAGWQWNSPILSTTTRAAVMMTLQSSYFRIIKRTWALGYGASNNCLENGRLQKRMA